MAPQKRKGGQRRVFVDTVAWIGLFNKRDALHARCKGIRKMLRAQRATFVTSEFVLLEFADACSSLALRAKGISFLEAIKHLSELTVVALSSELLSKGWRLYTQRLDQDWSLTDCTSFVVMKEERVIEALTFDHHFEQAGFVKLL